MGAKVEKQQHFNNKITDIAWQDLSSFFLIRTENVFNEGDKGKNLVGGLCRKKTGSMLQNSATGFKLFQAWCLVENNYIMIGIL